MTVLNSENLAIASRTTQTRIVIYPVLSSNCSKICNTCAGSNTTCTSCNVPSAYPILKDYTCMDSCGSGYFFDEPKLKCFPCHESCTTCYGPGNNKCYGCSANFVMQNGVCVRSCDFGYLENSETRQCMNPSYKCDKSCKTCSTNPSFCLSCDPTNADHAVFDRTVGKCIPNKASLCNDTTSSKFFINSTKLECERCTELCKTCEDSSKICTSC